MSLKTEQTDSAMRGFLLWLLSFGLICFLAWAAADAGFLAYAYRADASYIVVLIWGLFVVANPIPPCGGFYFGTFVKPNRPICFLAWAAAECGVTAYRGSALLEAGARPSEAELLQLAKECDTGWFLADIMLKLGLAGTVVGFVMMLSSVADIQGSDINTVQDVLVNMSSGMGTALVTTLSGLVGNGFTTVQYYSLEKWLPAADKA